MENIGIEPRGNKRGNVAPDSETDPDCYVHLPCVVGPVQNFESVSILKNRKTKRRRKNRKKKKEREALSTWKKRPFIAQKIVVDRTASGSSDDRGSSRHKLHKFPGKQVSRSRPRKDR